MLTYTCTLKFLDGSKITGTVRNLVSRYDDVQVEYSGDYTRLQERPDVSDVPFLRLHFQNFARDLGAEFTECHEGYYDYAE